jgi:glycosyltransferase involved in cell wall biosynthesis
VDRRSVEALFDREWDRVFGRARFDHVLNVEGYGPYWAMLLSRAPSHRSVWLHNQLWTDAHKYVEGKQPNRERLLAVFSTYPAYHELVSVSEPLSRLNAQDLGRFAGAARFVSVRNMLPAAELVALRASEGGRERAGSSTFVSVGRLSPEKGHALVVSAFRHVLDAVSSARLLLLGEGPERGDLEKLVADLGLDDVVEIAGHVDDALERVSRSACLVLASSHEGAPMVILEARSLGVPVIAADFPSVEGVLPQGTGTVVPRDVRSLAEAMLRTLRHENGTVLDPYAWNASAREELRTLVSRTVPDDELSA